MGHVKKNDFFYLFWLLLLVCVWGITQKLSSKSLELGYSVPCMLKINIFKKFCFLLFLVLKINESLNNCITLCKIFNDHILTRQWSDKEVSFVRVSARHCVLRFCMYLYFSAVTPQSECPHGWTRRDSSCYLFVTHVANDWTESEVRTVFTFLVFKNLFLILLSVILSLMFHW